jgi:tungstate transport system ATP-binding protein
VNQSSVTELPYALEAIGLSVVLGGQKVLEVSSLQVVTNEVLVVVGPNGSGKTTLLLSLALLLKPAAGTIYYKGCPVNNGADTLRLRRQFAVVFQDPLLLNTTVWDNVTLGLRLRGVEKLEIKKRAQKWLERFGVTSLATRQARTLSGGEAKRVSLARAFALQPEILFLDEPFVALDSPTRQGLIADFESVLRETAVSTIMVSHDHNEAIMLASRIAVLIGGSIRQIGNPADIFASPVDEEVASFVVSDTRQSGLKIR